MPKIQNQQDGMLYFADCAVATVGNYTEQKRPSIAEVARHLSIAYAMLATVRKFSRTIEQEFVLTKVVERLNNIINFHMSDDVRDKVVARYKQNRRGDGFIDPVLEQTFWPHTGLYNAQRSS